MCYRKLKFLDKTGRMSYNPPGISFRVQVQLLLFSPGPKSVLRGEVKEVFSFENCTFISIDSTRSFRSGRI
mgnify:CR=1 FL=1